MEKQSDSIRSLNTDYAQCAATIGDNEFKKFLLDKEIAEQFAKMDQINMKLKGIYQAMQEKPPEAPAPEPVAPESGAV